MGRNLRIGVPIKKYQETICLMGKPDCLRPGKDSDFNSILNQIPLKNLSFPLNLSINLKS